MPDLLAATLVSIAPAASARVVAHARETAPAECCGVLIGDSATILDAVRARNLSTDPNRFLIDPSDHIAARRAARQRRLEVVGFYHSHPRSAALPSPTDLAEASYPNHLYLIVSLQREPAEMRLFLLDGDRFRPVALVER